MKKKENSNACLVTATDSKFAFQALNLVASAILKTNVFKEFVVYDLGMKDFQRKLFEDLDMVRLEKVQPFTKYWKQCYSWKPWVIQQESARYRYIVYLDAGTEIQKNLKSVIDIIKHQGYFVVSQEQAISTGHYINQIMPTEYYDLFGLKNKDASKPVVAAGILGYDAKSIFARQVIQPWITYIKQGYNLGWSSSEGWRNQGIHYLPNAPVRDCKIFRQDQTVFNALLYRSMGNPKLESMKKYGWLDKGGSGQVIWNPKINGTFESISKLQYRQNNFIKHLAIWIYRLFG
ncbi:MAG: hypothetical protein U0526_02655 [Candidatus Saccharibacteria bacterium]